MTAVHIDIHDKTFTNGVRALEALKIDTVAGQFTAIVGPSGAGKSTLLNLISGLDDSYSGTVQIEDHDQSQIGFMFQESRLMPWLTVRQNIELVIEGLPQSQQRSAMARIPDLLTQVGLEQFSDAFPRQLSIGMQRRVSLLRAFIIQPKLLLMDEPFQSLDEPTADQLRALLLGLWRETGCSILFVTHDLHEAMLLADRILFLSPRPARVLLDHPVPLDRPRLARGSAISSHQQKLMQQHPRILAGAIAIQEPA